MLSFLKSQGGWEEPKYNSPRISPNIRGPSDAAATAVRPAEC